MSKQKFKIKFKMKIKGLGKKGMMDDLFDFLFTVMMAVFSLFFLNIHLSGGVDKAKEQGLDKLNLINSDFVLLNYLRAPIGLGRNIADLVSTSDLNLEELEKETYAFFSKDDCLRIVLSSLVELPQEVLQARGGAVPGEERLEERKILYCPRRAEAFERLPLSKTGKVELIGPQGRKTKVYLEFPK